MKVKIRRKSRRAGQTPASAMSDIAFLLIVFFMVIAVFAVKEGFIIKTPEKNQVLRKWAKDLLKVTLYQKKIMIGKKVVLKENFEQELREKKKGKRFFVFAIEKKVKYKEVIYVLDIFAKVKIYDFSMKQI